MNRWGISIDSVPMRSRMWNIRCGSGEIFAFCVSGLQRTAWEAFAR